MFEILLNLACQKIIEPNCVKVPLGDRRFLMLERKDSSMDQDEVQVEAAVAVEGAVAADGSEANAPDNSKRVGVDVPEWRLLIPRVLLTRRRLLA